MYNSILKPFLFTMQPEKAHSFAMKSAKCCQNMPFGSLLLKRLAGHPIETPTKVMDITFDNKVGLAAGFDKDGEYIETLRLLGFGFIEVGTITPRPQPGNPQ
ncbi:MAG TPA: dihydroorotate dehydrogenase (quinone), partial [Saprospiraceae bacterium]|nr:dihydroorotate dehydrogenase (quinone) [Saprospiraceae bacterium]